MQYLHRQIRIIQDPQEEPYWLKNLAKKYVREDKNQGSTTF